jgi:predicted acyltransferase
LGFLKITLVLGAFLAMLVINNQSENKFVMAALLLIITVLIIDTHAPTPHGKIGGICEDPHDIDRVAIANLRT